MFIHIYIFNFTVEEDAQLIPSGMSNDCVAQSWFRFLHILGTPAALCRPREIANTPRFHAFAIASESSALEPCYHPCLRLLTVIFLKAVKGIAGQVDAFLGEYLEKMFICVECMVGVKLKIV